VSPIVVVDVPPEAKAELVDALVSACNDSFEEGTCVAAGSRDPGSAPPRAVVIVVVDANGLEFHLELGVRDSDT
jgi:hypothetical protein